MHQIYCWTDPDGTITTYDIPTAIAIGRAKGLLGMVAVAGVAGSPEEFLLRYPELDVAYAMTTDLSRPIVALQHNEAWIVADGNHRLYHAMLLGIEEIPCYFLGDPADVAETVLCVTPGGSHAAV